MVAGAQGNPTAASVLRTGWKEEKPRSPENVEIRPENSSSLTRESGEFLPGTEKEAVGVAGVQSSRDRKSPVLFLCDNSDEGVEIAGNQGESGVRRRSASGRNSCSGA